MKIPLPAAITHFLKRLVPESLFARALLILLIPTLIVQVVATYVFFTRHLENVTLYLSRSLAGEVAILVNQVERASPRERDDLMDIAQQLLNINVKSVSPDKWPAAPSSKSSRFQEFIYQMHARTRLPFKVMTTPDEGMAVYVRMKNEVLIMTVPVKRIASSTPYIFLGWMSGTALLFLVIATLFLRGQVRPIVTLARAAGSFGRGEDSPDFRPQGAREVRLAGSAFVTMKERIQRLLRTRVDMLAGISHDLRTPIARMKLQLAMMGGGADIEGMQSDLTQMEGMIAEYLDFVRGAGGEEVQPVNINALLQEVADDYRRQGADVRLETPRPVTLSLRPNAFRRVMANLIGNALRYGTRCVIAVTQESASVCIRVEDNGPGIAPADREAVFQPFRRLDVSRNLESGGVGLGLTIVRDIVHAHGGEILLEDAPGGGLRVIIRLPRS
jgi:two-component system osmolarity sensor histidine kinase EnvZ